MCIKLCENMEISSSIKNIMLEIYIYIYIYIVSKAIKLYGKTTLVKI